jgi:putative ABC transport system permease protein
VLHRLAWLQLITEKRRLAAALAGISFGVMLQFMQFGFRDAMFQSATTFHDSLDGEIVITSSLYESIVGPGTIARRRLQQALAVPGVRSVAPVNVTMAPMKNPISGADKALFVVGLDPDRVVLNIPSVIENAHLIKVPDVAIFDALSRPEFGPIPELVQRNGRVITEVAGRRTTIAGLFQLGVSFAGNGHLIESDTTFRKQFNRPEGTFEFGVVRLEPGADIAAVQAELGRRLPKDVRVLNHAQLREIEIAHWNENTPIGFIFLAGLLVGLLVGAVIVYQILYTDVSDHLGEYATLKAMGYSDRHLSFVVLEEAFILSLVGFPIGYAMGELLYYVARDATHLPMVMTRTRAGVVFALTVVMCGISALLALRKLKAADPAEVF